MADVYPDILVVLPGISGSVLTKDGLAIWDAAPDAFMRGLFTGGRGVKDLTLVDDDPEKDDVGDGVIASALIQDLHIVPGLWHIDGYSKLAALLEHKLNLEAGHNYFEFPYDWRRDNRVAARKLARLSHDWLERWRERSGNAEAKLVLIAHSLGGLVARYFLEVLGGWQCTRSLITFGTPYAGSLNAVGFIANGYTKGIWPLRVDLSATLRSYTSVYQLLPIYPCIDDSDGKGKLKRVVDIELPNLDQERTRRAREFHLQIRCAQKENAKDEGYQRNGYAIYPVVGKEQPTYQSARYSAGEIVLLHTIRGDDPLGDGTVPRGSATPLERSQSGREMFSADRHGSLQNADAVLTHLDGLLSARFINPGEYRAPEALPLRLDLDDVYPAATGSLITVRADREGLTLHGLVVNVETGHAIDRLDFVPLGEGKYTSEFSLPSGLYRLTVAGDAGVCPVTDTFAVVSTAD
jgi:hypothetical protein